MTNKIKYPRTPHLPWSEGATNDDKVLKSLNSFIDQEVIVSIKMDGENTTIYNDAIHSRSLDSKSHPSRNKIKAFLASISYKIPYRWRVCLENCTAKHSIHYKHLTSLWYGISIWDIDNVCLNWPDTLDLLGVFGIEPVPVIYRGVFDEKVIKNLHQSTFNGDECEGYVVRLASSFTYEDFDKSVAKYVRAKHVQTDSHWMQSQMVPNLTLDK
jgi:hypothetical protein